jgi:hypothetical protein
MTLNPVASELLLPEIRRRHCRLPTINRGRDTALPSPLSSLSATGIDMTLIAIDFQMQLSELYEEFNFEMEDE